MPDLDEATRERIINAGKKVLAARELYPERSLANHHTPLAMSLELVKVHDALTVRLIKRWERLANSRARSNAKRSHLVATLRFFMVKLPRGFALTSANGGQADRSQALARPQQ
nr:MULTISPECIES: type IIL restriction-modification enzyme MmeI [unclassified Corynebacterium]